MDLSTVLPLADTATEIIEHKYHISEFWQVVIMIAATPLIIVAVIGFPGILSGLFCYQSLHWSPIASIGAGLMMMCFWFLFLAMES